METDTGQEIISPVDRTSYEADQPLAQQLSSEFSLQTVVDDIRKAAQADVVIFYLYDRVSEHFHLSPYVSGTLFDPDTHQAMYPVQTHMLSRLAFYTEPIFAESSETLYYLLHDHTTPIPELHFYQREQVRSTAVMPLCLKAKLVGALFVSFRQTQQFDPPQRQLIESLAYYAAISINMGQALSTLSKRRIHEQAILQSIDRELNTKLELTEVLFELVHRLGNSLGLVGYYINAIQEELQMKGVVSEYISEKLGLIDRSASSVLQLSNQIKRKVVRTAAETHDGPVLFPPQVLLDETLGEITIPTNIRMYRRIEPAISEILIYPSLVVNSLHNLIINAIQAMSEGGELTCSIYNRGHSVVFEVKDTGVGIPPEQHTKIFDLFYSTKNSSGFGLWSARRNALKNRGKLELQSSVPGNGTTFVLLFPREEVYGQ